MIHQAPSAATTFGYLSAVESAEHGFFGGYLLVSPLGRPVEFHCTAPVRPSRAQEILYGPTLQPYLLGEQIAGTLLAKAQTKPQIILTDQSFALCHRPKLSIPIAYWNSKNPSVTDSDAGNSISCDVLVFGHAFDLAPGFESDRDAVIALLNTLANHVDLPEPFERIHEAIREAQRISQGGTNVHGAAA
jgi:hypothetical protein